MRTPIYSRSTGFREKLPRFFHKAAHFLMGSINFQLEAEAKLLGNAELDVQIGLQPGTVYLLLLNGREQEHLLRLGPRFCLIIIGINQSAISVFIWDGCWGKRSVI